jgi:hypothetical protein
MLAVLVWGMRLETQSIAAQREISALRQQLDTVQQEINKGILPLTQERLARIGREVESIRDGLGFAQHYHAKNTIEIERLKLVWARLENRMERYHPAKR